MSQASWAVLFFAFNSVHLINPARSEDLYQNLRKSGLNANVEEAKRQTHDADRIKTVNSLNPAGTGASKKRSAKVHLSPAADNGPDDEQDQIAPGSAILSPVAQATTSPAAHGYRKKERANEKASEEIHIQVNSDGSPQELSFPGTDD